MGGTTLHAGIVSDVTESLFGGGGGGGGRPSSGRGAQEGIAMKGAQSKVKWGGGGA